MEEFKKVITGLKYQFSERTKDKLISTNDVNGAVTRLFMATGLAKVNLFFRLEFGFKFIVYTNGAILFHLPLGQPELS